MRVLREVTQGGQILVREVLDHADLSSHGEVWTSLQMHPL